MRKRGSGTRIFNILLVLFAALALVITAYLLIPKDISGGISSESLLQIPSSDRPQVTEIALDEATFPTVVHVGQDVDPSSIAIIVTYADQSTERVLLTDEATNNLDFTIPGTQLVTFVYQGKSYSFPVTVTEYQYDVQYQPYTGGSIMGQLQQTVNESANALTVEAIPDVGYRFSKWSDGVLTPRRTDKKVMADLFVYAIFERLEYTVAFIGGNNEILVTQTVRYGGSATPPANPKKEGYIFTGWSPAYNYIIENCTIKAQFEYNMTDISVQSNNSVYGKIKLGNLTDRPVASASGAFQYESPVVITAFPDANFQFAGWYLNGELVSSNPTFVFTVERDFVNGYNFTAQFTADTVNINFHDYTLDTEGNKNYPGEIGGMPSLDGITSLVGYPNTMLVDIILADLITRTVKSNYENGIALSASTKAALFDEIFIALLDDQLNKTMSEDFCGQIFEKVRNLLVLERTIGNVLSNSSISALFDDAVATGTAPTQALIDSLVAVFYSSVVMRSADFIDSVYMNSVSYSSVYATALEAIRAALQTVFYHKTGLSESDLVATIGQSALDILFDDLLAVSIEDIMDAEVGLSKSDIEIAIAMLPDEAIGQTANEALFEKLSVAIAAKNTTERYIRTDAMFADVIASNIGADGIYLPHNTLRGNNFIFEGWYFNDVKVGNDFFVNESVNLYAKWTPVEYTVTFDKMYEEATIAFDHKKIFYGYEVDALPIPQLENYKFLGWYTSVDYDNPNTRIYDSSDIVTGNITVVARWEVVTYNLKFGLTAGMGSVVEKIGDNAYQSISDNLAIVDSGSNHSYYITSKTGHLISSIFIGDTQVELKKNGIPVAEAEIDGKGNIVSYLMNFTSVSSSAVITVNYEIAVYDVKVWVSTEYLDSYLNDEKITNDHINALINSTYNFTNFESRTTYGVDEFTGKWTAYLKNMPYGENVSLEIATEAIFEKGFYIAEIYVDGQKSSIADKLQTYTLPISRISYDVEVKICYRIFEYEMKVSLVNQKEASVLAGRASINGVMQPITASTYNVSITHGDRASLALWALDGYYISCASFYAGDNASTNIGIDQPLNNNYETYKYRYLNGSGTPYIWSQTIKSDHNITVNYTLFTYTVTPSTYNADYPDSTNPYGVTDPLGQVVKNFGADSNFILETYAGYYIEKVWGDGTLVVNQDTSYKFAYDGTCSDNAYLIAMDISEFIRAYMKNDSFTYPIGESESVLQSTGSTVVVTKRSNDEYFFTIGSNSYTLNDIGAMKAYNAVRALNGINYYLQNGSGLSFEFPLQGGGFGGASITEVTPAKVFTFTFEGFDYTITFRDGAEGIYDLEIRNAGTIVEVGTLTVTDTVNEKYTYYRDNDENKAFNLQYVDDDVNYNNLREYYHEYQVELTRLSNTIFKYSIVIDHNGDFTVLVDSESGREGTVKVSPLVNGQLPLNSVIVFDETNSLTSAIFEQYNLRSNKSLRVEYRIVLLDIGLEVDTIATEESTANMNGGTVTANNIVCVDNDATSLSVVKGPMDTAVSTPFTESVGGVQTTVYKYVLNLSDTLKIDYSAGFNISVNAKEGFYIKNLIIGGNPAISNGKWSNAGLLINIAESNFVNWGELLNDLDTINIQTAANFAVSGVLFAFDIVVEFAVNAYSLTTVKGAESFGAETAVMTKAAGAGKTYTEIEIEHYQNTTVYLKTVEGYFVRKYAVTPKGVAPTVWTELYAAGNQPSQHITPPVSVNAVTGDMEIHYVLDIYRYQYSVDYAESSNNTYGSFVAVGGNENTDLDFAASFEINFTSAVNKYIQKIELRFFSNKDRITPVATEEHLLRIQRGTTYEFLTKQDDRRSYTLNYANNNEAYDYVKVMVTFAKIERKIDVSVTGTSDVVIQSSNDGFVTNNDAAVSTYYGTGYSFRYDGATASNPAITGYAGYQSETVRLQIRPLTGYMVAYVLVDSVPITTMSTYGNPTNIPENTWSQYEFVLNANSSVEVYFIETSANFLLISDNILVTSGGTGKISMQLDGVDVTNSVVTLGTATTLTMRVFTGFTIDKFFVDGEDKIASLSVVNSADYKDYSFVWSPALASGAHVAIVLFAIDTYNLEYNLSGVGEGDVNMHANTPTDPENSVSLDQSTSSYTVPGEDHFGFIDYYRFKANYDSTPSFTVTAYSGYYISSVSCSSISQIAGRFAQAQIEQGTSTLTEFLFEFASLGGTGIRTDLVINITFGVNNYEVSGETFIAGSAQGTGYNNEFQINTKINNVNRQAVITNVGTDSSTASYQSTATLNIYPDANNGFYVDTLIVNGVNVITGGVVELGMGDILNPDSSVAYSFSVNGNSSVSVTYRQKQYIVDVSRFSIMTTGKVNVLIYPNGLLNEAVAPSGDQIVSTGKYRLAHGTVMAIVLTPTTGYHLGYLEIKKDGVSEIKLSEGVKTLTAGETLELTSGSIYAYTLAALTGEFELFGLTYLVNDYFVYVDFDTTGENTTSGNFASSQGTITTLPDGRLKVSTFNYNLAGQTFPIPTFTIYTGPTVGSTDTGSYIYSVFLVRETYEGSFGAPVDVTGEIAVGTTGTVQIGTSFVSAAINSIPVNAHLHFSVVCKKFTYDINSQIAVTGVTTVEQTTTDNAATNTAVTESVYGMTNQPIVVAHGDAMTIKIIPEVKYQLAELSVNSVLIDISTDVVYFNASDEIVTNFADAKYYTYTMNGITAEVYIVVTYEIREYAYSLSILNTAVTKDINNPDDFGSVTVYKQLEGGGSELFDNQMTKVEHGDNLTLYFSADILKGYFVDNVTINGLSYISNGQAIIIENISGNETEGSVTVPTVSGILNVSITFKKRIYTVSVSAGTNGSVEADSDTTPYTYEYGSKVNLTFKANLGHHLAQFNLTHNGITNNYYASKVEGTSDYVWKAVGEEGAPTDIRILNYSLNSIASNVNVSVVYTINTYTVSVGSGTITGGTLKYKVGNKSIAPYVTPFVVNYEDDIIFYVEPATGYYLSAFSIDNSSRLEELGNSTSYIYNDVTRNTVVDIAYTMYSYNVYRSSQGTVSIDRSPATINYGGSATFIMTPAVGRDISYFGFYVGSDPGSTGFSNLSQTSFSRATACLLIMPIVEALENSLLTFDINGASYTLSTVGSVENTYTLTYKSISYTIVKYDMDTYTISYTYNSIPYTYSVDFVNNAGQFTFSMNYVYDETLTLGLSMRKVNNAFYVTVSGVTKAYLNYAVGVYCYADIRTFLVGSAPVSNHEFSVLTNIAKQGEIYTYVGGVKTSLNSPIVINYGSSLEIYVQAFEGYKISEIRSVLENKKQTGIVLEGDAGNPTLIKLIINQVITAYTFSAEFDLFTYTVTAKNHLYGCSYIKVTTTSYLDPENPTYSSNIYGDDIAEVVNGEIVATVTHFDKVAFILTPIEGYKLSSLQVNQKTGAVENSYYVGVVYGVSVGYRQMVGSQNLVSLTGTGLSTDYDNDLRVCTFTINSMSGYAVATPAFEKNSYLIAVENHVANPSVDTATSSASTVLYGGTVSVDFKLEIGYYLNTIVLVGTPKGKTPVANAPIVYTISGGVINIPTGAPSISQYSTTTKNNVMSGSFRIDSVNIDLSIKFTTLALTSLQSYENIVYEAGYSGIVRSANQGGEISAMYTNNLPVPGGDNPSVAAGNIVPTPDKFNAMGNEILSYYSVLTLQATPFGEFGYVFRGWEEYNSNDLTWKPAESDGIVRVNGMSLNYTVEARPRIFRAVFYKQYSLRVYLATDIKKMTYNNTDYYVQFGNVSATTKGKAVTPAVGSQNRYFDFVYDYNSVLNITGYDRLDAQNKITFEIFDDQYSGEALFSGAYDRPYQHVITGDASVILSFNTQIELNASIYTYDKYYAPEGLEPYADNGNQTIGGKINGTAGLNTTVYTASDNDIYTSARSLITLTAVANPGYRFLGWVVKPHKTVQGELFTNALAYTVTNINSSNYYTLAFENEFYLVTPGNFTFNNGASISNVFTVNQDGNTLTVSAWMVKYLEARFIKTYEVEKSMIISDNNVNNLLVGSIIFSSWKNTIDMLSGVYSSTVIKTSVYDTIGAGETQRDIYPIGAMASYTCPGNEAYYKLDNWSCNYVEQEFNSANHYAQEFTVSQDLSVKAHYTRYYYIVLYQEARSGIKNIVSKFNAGAYDPDLQVITMYNEGGVDLAGSSNVTYQGVPAFTSYFYEYTAVENPWVSGNSESDAAVVMTLKVLHNTTLDFDITSYTEDGSTLETNYYFVFDGWWRANTLNNTDYYGKTSGGTLLWQPETCTYSNEKESGNYSYCIAGISSDMGYKLTCIKQQPITVSSATFVYDPLGATDYTPEGKMSTSGVYSPTTANPDQQGLTKSQTLIGGTVTIAQSAAKDAYFDESNTVTKKISATANTGYVFTGWYDAAGTRVCTTNTYEFYPNQPRIYEARFVAVYTVSGTSRNVSMIKALNSPTGGGLFMAGSKATLSATRKGNSDELIGWTVGDYSGSAFNTYMGEIKTLPATVATTSSFTKDNIQFTITKNITDIAPEFQNPTTTRAGADVTFANKSSHNSDSTISFIVSKDYTVLSGDIICSWSITYSTVTITGIEGGAEFWMGLGAGGKIIDSKNNLPFVYEINEPYSYYGVDSNGDGRVILYNVAFYNGNTEYSYFRILRYGQSDTDANSVRGLGAIDVTSKNMNVITVSNSAVTAPVGQSGDTVPEDSKTWFGGGVGNATYPYLIYTVESWNRMVNFTGNFSATELTHNKLYFKLMSNITLGTGAVNNAVPFKNKDIDGNGKKIIINGNSSASTSVNGMLARYVHAGYYGFNFHDVVVTCLKNTYTSYNTYGSLLFGQLAPTGFSVTAGRSQEQSIILKNVTVSGTIYSTYNYIGGFVGNLAGGTSEATSVLIEGCSAIGKVTGGFGVGGFISSIGQTAAYTLLKDCTAALIVTGSSDVGGFVGEMRNGIIAGGSSNCSINASSMAGGFVGYMDGANTAITYIAESGADNQYPSSGSSVAVSASTDGKAGGIVGWLAGGNLIQTRGDSPSVFTIFAGANSGNSGRFLGGGIGYRTAGNIYQMIITSPTIGDGAHKIDYAGGAIGYNQGQIGDAFNFAGVAYTSTNNTYTSSNANGSCAILVYSANISHYGPDGSAASTETLGGAIGTNKGSTSITVKFIRVLAKSGESYACVMNIIFNKPQDSRSYIYVGGFGGTNDGGAVNNSYAEMMYVNFICNVECNEEYPYVYLYSAFGRNYNSGTVSISASSVPGYIIIGDDDSSTIFNDDNLVGKKSGPKAQAVGSGG